MLRRTLDEDSLVLELDILNRCLEQLGCQFGRLLANGTRGGADGVAGDYRRPAGIRPRAPVHRSRVAGRDGDLVWPDPQFVGHDLREAGLVPLTLRADA